MSPRQRVGDYFVSPRQRDGIPRGDVPGQHQLHSPCLGGCSSPGWDAVWLSYRWIPGIALLQEAKAKDVRTEHISQQMPTRRWSSALPRVTLHLSNGWEKSKILRDLVCTQVRSGNSASGYIYVFKYLPHSAEHTCSYIMLICCISSVINKLHFSECVWFSASKYCFRSGLSIWASVFTCIPL